MAAAEPVLRAVGARLGSEREAIFVPGNHDAAFVHTRTKGSYLQAQYQRLRPRIGHGRALGAIKHSMPIAYWHMFTTGETYNDLGGDYFQRRDPERHTQRLVKKLEALGHTVALTPTAA
jgi:transposase